MTAFAMPFACAASGSGATGVRVCGGPSCRTNGSASFHASLSALVAEVGYTGCLGACGTGVNFVVGGALVRRGNAGKVLKAGKLKGCRHSVRAIRLKGASDSAGGLYAQRGYKLSLSALDKSNNETRWLRARILSNCAAVALELGDAAESESLAMEAIVEDAKLGAGWLRLAQARFVADGAWREALRDAERVDVDMKRRFNEWRGERRRAMLWRFVYHK